MRWHVHGTDAVTGEDVELAVNDQQAEQAVKAAHDRHIVVSHVTGDDQNPWHRMVKPLVALSLITLAGISVGLFAYSVSLRGKLDQAINEQTRMARSVATAENTAAEIREHGNLADTAAAQVQKLADELAVARSRMSLTEQQLSAAHKNLNDLEQAAARVTEAEGQAAALNQQLATAKAQLRDGEKLLTQLRTEMALQSKRMEQMEHLPLPPNPAVAQAARLEAANKELAAEIDTLKQELLVAVVKADTPAPVTDMPPPAAPLTWAMRLSYDTAKNFLVLHTDHDTVVTRATADTGQMATIGMLTENAARLRIVHDRAKERVYSATLTVSLASDAPKEKLAENAQLIRDFLHLFVAGIKEPDPIVAAAAKELAGQDESRRSVYLAQDMQLTIWNNKSGLFTFEVAAFHE